MLCFGLSSWFFCFVFFELLGSVRTQNRKITKRAVPRHILIKLNKTSEERKSSKEAGTKKPKPPKHYIQKYYGLNSVQFSCSVVSDSLRPHECSMPGLPVHHQLPDFTQIHVHRVGDAIQPSHPWSSPSPPAPNPSQHQNLFQWVNSSHEVAKVLELQL